MLKKITCMEFYNMSELLFKKKKNKQNMSDLWM